MKNKRSVLCQFNVIVFSFSSKVLFSSPISILFHLILFMLFLCQNNSTSMAQNPTSKSALSTNDDSLTTSPDYSMSSFNFQSSVTNPIKFNTKTQEVPVENVIVDAGNDVRLNCTEKSQLSSNSSITWIRQHSNETSKGLVPPPFTTSDIDGSILLQNISHVSDNATYTCIVNNRKLKVLHLRVKTTPLAVINLSVIPHSVYALVRWKMPNGRDGGHPILRYELLYRIHETYTSFVNKNSSSTANQSQTAFMKESESIQLINDWNPGPPSKEEYEWQVYDNNISPNATSKVVYNLRPNSSYSFQLYAINKLGNGQHETVSTVTKYSIEEINEAITLLSEKGMASLYLKISIIVITVILVTFAILGLGISLVVFRSCGCGKSNAIRHEGISCEALEDEEAMELVPHITLNPSFNIDMLEYLEAEESPTSDLHYPPLSSLGMAAAARVGTSASIRAAASKAAQVATATPVGTSAIRKCSVAADDTINLVKSRFQN